MPKSKETISTSESDGSDNETAKKSKKRTEKQATTKEAPAKKAKKDSESDNSWDLGNNRQITVREFKGKLLIDIREMYMDGGSGEMKPGKKGIALNAQQWKKLYSVMDEVEKAVNKN